MPPILAVIGKKNCGKTTLIEKLIPELIRLGYRVGTIKHHHGAISMDTPGKDTWRHKQAGAHAVILSSPTGLGLVRDTSGEVPVPELVRNYLDDMDIVLTEGYKKEKLPKIEIFRSSVHSDPLAESGDNLIAMVSDIKTNAGIPHFGLDEIRSLARFVAEKILISSRKVDS